MYEPTGGSRLLKRLDLRGHLTFQGNDDLEQLAVRDERGKLGRVEMPGDEISYRFAVG